MFLGAGTSLAAEGADRAAEQDLVRDHVGVVAANDLADGYHHRVVTVGRPRDELVDAADQVRGGGNRIERLVRPGRVSAAAPNFDGQVVAGRGQRSIANADPSQLARGVHVQAQDGGHILQCSGGHHLAGSGAGLLGRLEDASPATGPGQSTSLFELLEPQDRSQHGGCVGIVAASVHHAVMLAVVVHRLAVGDFEGVDIGTQRDPRLARLARQVGNQAAAAGSQTHLVAGLHEHVMHVATALHLLAGRFRVHVQMPADFDHAGELLFDGFAQRGRPGPSRSIAGRSSLRGSGGRSTRFLMHHGGTNTFRGGLRDWRELPAHAEDCSTRLTRGRCLLVS